MEDEDGEKRAVGEEGGDTSICYTQAVAYVQLLTEGGRGRREGGREERVRGGVRGGGRKEIKFNPTTQSWICPFSVLEFCNCKYYVFCSKSYWKE